MHMIINNSLFLVTVYILLYLVLVHTYGQTYEHILYLFHKTVLLLSNFKHICTVIET